MDLYAHLARVYDRIFPVNPTSLALIDALPGSKEQQRRAIDLGSATGGHAFGLAQLGWHVSGVELSDDLLELSRTKQAGKGPAVEFIKADMRDLGRLFATASADLILCLGNTLPHLDNLKEIQDFLVSARDILRRGGHIVLQVVNFDLAGPGYLFPTLEESGLRFERSYSSLPDGKIAFDTRLSLGEGRTYSDRTALFPLTPSLLESALQSAGFSIERKLSSWDGSAFEPASSLYLIIVGGISASPA